MKKLHKTFAGLLALIMALGLAACGGGGGGADDPNAGKYLGYQVNMLGWTPIEEIYSGENYIELKGNGKGEMVLDGDGMKLDWSLEGETLTMTADGQDCNATLKDGVIITDLFGVEILLCFVKEGVEPPVLEGETLEENIDGMVDEALDEMMGDETGVDSAADTGELAEYTFGEGAYTVTYPAGSWVPSDWRDALNEPAGFGLIEFYIQENQEQVEETINNLNVLLETAQDYQVTDTTYMDAVAQEVLVTDEYGEQSLKILIEHGQDMGAAGVALYVNVVCWDYVDQDVVRSILNSIVMN